MRRKEHTHRCACGAFFECAGELERNHDGWPEVICRVFHIDGDRTCPVCYLAEQQGEEAEPECEQPGHACNAGCGFCGRCCSCRRPESKPVTHGREGSA